MRKLILLGTLAALLVPTASRAQGLQLGLRLGYAPAMGDAFQVKGDPQAAKMSDGVKSQVPLQLDVSYRFDKFLAAGAYLSYGFGQVGGQIKDLCDSNGLDCSASVVRVGVQGIYTFSQAQAALVPWAAVNLGYERGKLEASGFGASGSETASGWELGLTVGGDYRATPQFAIGPFVGLSLGQYTSAESGGALGGGSLDIDKKLHEWLQLGVRGTFDL